MSLMRVQFLRLSEMNVSCRNFPSIFSLVFSKHGVLGIFTYHHFREQQWWAINRRLSPCKPMVYTAPYSKQLETEIYRFKKKQILDSCYSFCFLTYKGHVKPVLTLEHLLLRREYSPISNSMFKTCVKNAFKLEQRATCEWHIPM